MKKFALLLTFALVPVPVYSQQVNTYNVCTQYREVYQPGYYDQNGYYNRGGVITQSYNVPCNGNVTNNAPQYYQRQRICNPTAGAVLGAGIAGAISGGSSRTNSGSWYNNYSRTYSSNGSSSNSSGGWSNTTKNNYYWQMLGAGLGALMFGC